MNFDKVALHFKGQGIQRYKESYYSHATIKTLETHILVPLIASTSFLASLKVSSELWSI
jgi:hypothetical protein